MARMNGNLSGLVAELEGMDPKQPSSAIALREIAGEVNATDISRYGDRELLRVKYYLAIHAEKAGIQDAAFAQANTKITTALNPPGEW